MSLEAPMQAIFDFATIRSLAPMPSLIAAIEEAFRIECVAPSRSIYAFPETSGRLLVSMPAFHPDGSAAVKLATVFRDNVTIGLPTVQAAIVVFSATGAPTVILDGVVVTQLRTGAASAVASKYLSREDASHLLVVGTGALAPAMALAHSSVRPIKHIAVWGRNPQRAARTRESIRALCPNIEVGAAESLEEALPRADIVTCATRAESPIIAGKLLKNGSFVDLVGSFSPSAREADDDVVLRARIFVDTREGTLAEAGDLIDPINRGVIAAADIEGSLAELVRGEVRGRSHADEITLFKSVGSAIEDLAAARMIVQRVPIQTGL
jgi:alanine dehydrogenase